jgi:MFS family permease
MRFDWWLSGLCGSRVFTYLVFLTYAATLPVLRTQWGMSASAAGSISSGFQIAYAFSLLIFSELADRIGARRVFLWSNFCTAIASLLFAIFARGYYSGLILYTLVGFSLGGTYTTGLMMIADRVPSASRGRAIGFFIASTSLSYALSLCLAGSIIPWGGYRGSFLLTCLGPLVGTALAWKTLASTPNKVFPRHEGREFFSKVLRNRPALLFIIAYALHCWELIGMWSWTPAFMSAALVVRGSGTLRATGESAFIVGASHLVGMVASLIMGTLSDRFGRAVMILVGGGTSAACSFAMGWLIGLPIFFIVIVGMIYAFSAIGDSPILSAGMTEHVDPAYMGAAFALRSFLGFGAGSISPLLFGAILDLSNPVNLEAGGFNTWGWSYSMLGLGGLGVVVTTYLLYKDSL